MMTVNLICYKKIKCEFVYSATAMKNITKDYQLGFGSFVDKTVSPFIRTESKKPCDENEKCIPAYGFRNVLKLVKDPKIFEVT